MKKLWEISLVPPFSLNRHWLFSLWSAIVSSHNQSPYISRISLDCLQYYSFHFTWQACSSNHQIHSSQIWIQPMVFTALRAFRATVRHAENLYKSTHSALDWSSFKSLRNHYHKLILAAKKQYYSHLVSSSSENPRRLWQTVNRLLHRKSSSPLPSSMHLGHFTRRQLCFFLHRQNFQSSDLSNQQFYCVSTYPFSTINTSCFFYLQAGTGIWNL